MKRKASKKFSACDGCPYGKHQPCIGWCTRKILKELKEKRKRHDV